MLERIEILESDVERKPVVAVTMATGRQGIGVVKELSQTDKYHIRAITRNIKSTKALELGSLNNVELVEGDLMDPESLNKAFEGVDVIFGNTTPTKGWKLFRGSIVRSYEMEQGLRVVGTVEFGGLNNPPSKKRILNLVNNAKYLFPELKEYQDEWLGFRPTLPDFLPIIGPSKNHKNLFYSFGHHHLGWTLGAISGKIISGMIAGENSNLDLSPYNSQRFS